MSIHLLGAIAIVVMTLLPGAALVSRRWGDSPLERLGLVCGTSLAINCFALMVLNVLGLYGVFTARLWFGLVLTASAASLAWRRAFRHEGRVREPVGSSNGLRQDALAVPILLIVFLKTSFFPFSSWDAIASWNRWARAYFLVPNFFQQDQFFYPQYHSWAMSFPYMLMGDPTIEYYSHAVAVAYALVLYAGVARLSRVLGFPGWLAFCLLFVTGAMTKWVGTGYADDAAAAFSTLSVAFVLESIERGEPEAGLRRALAGGALAGSAFLFKPSAAAVTLSVPVLGVLLVARGSFVRRAVLAGGALLAALLIVSPWLASSRTALAHPQLKMVMSGIHDGVSHSQVIQTGIRNLRENGTLAASQLVDWAALGAAALLALYAMKKTRSALCLGLVVFAMIPIWINTTNYDARAILPVVPLAVVIAAAGLFYLTCRMMGERLARTSSLGIALGSLGLFLVLELDPGGALVHRSAFDVRPGDQWARLGLLAGQREKGSLLLPALGDLHAWQEAHPSFASSLWSDSLISAAVDPWTLNGGGRWVGGLFDRRGEPQWRPGDVLFISDGMRTEPVRPPWVLGVSMDLTTWEEWLASIQSSGVIRAKGRWGEYQAYEVASLVHQLAAPAQ